MLDEEDSVKKIVSLQIIQNKPYFSTQALSEVINVCRKRWKYDKNKLVSVSEFLLKNCKLMSISADTIKSAHSLIARYDFQYFDALIVANALENHSDVLYTEDMQSGLLINDRLKLINPFKQG